MGLGVALAAYGAICLVAGRTPRLGQALDALADGDVLEAERVLVELTRRRPDDARALVYLGDLLSSMSDHRGAAVAWARASAAVDGGAWGEYARGQLLLEQGQPAAAAAAYSRALERGFPDPRVLAGRAHARALTGHYDAALRDSDEVVGRPGYRGVGLALRSRIRVMQCERADQGERGELLALAAEDANAAVALEPGNPEVYAFRSIVRAMERDLDGAKADVERCRALGGQPPASVRDALAAPSGAGRASNRPPASVTSRGPDGAADSIEESAE